MGLAVRLASEHILYFFSPRLDCSRSHRVCAPVIVFAHIPHIRLLWMHTRGARFVAATPFKRDCWLTFGQRVMQRARGGECTIKRFPGARDRSTTKRNERARAEKSYNMGISRSAWRGWVHIYIVLYKNTQWMYAYSLELIFDFCDQERFANTRAEWRRNYMLI